MLSLAITGSFLSLTPLRAVPSTGDSVFSAGWKVRVLQISGAATKLTLNPTPPSRHYKLPQPITAALGGPTVRYKNVQALQIAGIAARRIDG